MVLGLKEVKVYRTGYINHHVGTRALEVKDSGTLSSSLMSSHTIFSHEHIMWPCSA